MRPPNPRTHPCYALLPLTLGLGYLGGSRDGPGVRPGSDGHPLGLRFIQMMVYLTDCDDDTHCISFCPESLLQSDPTLTFAQGIHTRIYMVAHMEKA